MDEKTVSRLLTILITLVTIGWLATLIIPAFVHEYRVPPEVNVIMLAIVGFLTGSYAKAKKPEADPKEKDDDERK